MNCQELRDLIPDYLSGELSGPALCQFESHRGECADCRFEIEQFESAWMLLGEHAEEEPGPDLRARFYTMLEAEKRRLAGSWQRRVEAWVGSWWPRRPAVQMAVAASMLVVGLAAGARLGAGGGRDAEVAELRGDVQQMRQMVSLSFLEQESPGVRLRGVNWSANVSEPSEALLASLIEAAESDPNENVRMAAVGALSLFRDEPGVVDALTRALEEESSPMVQVVLIDTLIEIRERRSLEALKSFLEKRDVVPSVKEHAEKQIGEFM